MTPRTTIQAIASAIEARANCARSGNTEWFARHTERLEQLAADCLPSGAGIDNGTGIDLVASRADRVMLTFEYHFMAESGMYDGWGSYRAIIRPAFVGIDIDVKGRDRDGIKEYLRQTIECALEQLAPQYAQPTGVVLA